MFSVFTLIDEYSIWKENHYLHYSLSSHLISVTYFLSGNLLSSVLPYTEGLTSLRTSMNTFRELSSHRFDVAA